MTSSDAPVSATVIALPAGRLILHVDGSIDTAASDARRREAADPAKQREAPAPASVSKIKAVPEAALSGRLQLRNRAA